MKYMANNSCLLIIPKHFYSFQKQFKAQLELRNYKVEIVNDEYPENIVGLLLGKLKIPILKKITFNHYRDRILINNIHYDLVLIFKGRGISIELINLLKLHSDKIVGYNWDSFAFNKSPINWYTKIDKYSTFDHKDSIEYKLPLIELFSSSENKEISTEKSVDFKFSAIFRNHSQRLKYLFEVMKYYDINNQDIFIYIFEKNIFFAVLNFLASPIQYIRFRKFISFKPLEYSKYSSAIRNSEYTIDYAHPKQTGLTMRCFEALNSKTKIITNNIYIKDSIFFNQANYNIFTLERSVIKRKESFEQLDFENSIKTKWVSRTIIDFFNDLLA